MIRALVVLFLAAFALPVHAGQRPAAAPAPSQDPLVRMNEAIDALTKKVWPSVVQIIVSSYGARDDARGVGDGAVRRTHRTCRHQRAAVEEAGDAVNRGHVDGIAERQRRQDRGEAACEHGLAGSGRADQQHPLVG